MARLIDADALFGKLSRMIDYCREHPKVNGLAALFEVGDAIMDCKTVDDVEVVHGRWKKANNRPKSYIRVCSVCGKEAYFCGEGCSYKYCPNCGAKMDGEENYD